MVRLVVDGGMRGWGNTATSVSYASGNRALRGGEAMPEDEDEDDDRRDTRIFLPLPTVVALTGDFFRGDEALRGDLFRTGDRWTDDEEDDDEGIGVGGNSANINCTCQDLFSSKNLIRSACRKAKRKSNECK